MSAFKLVKGTWSAYKDLKKKQQQKKVIKRLGLDIKDRFYYPSDTVSGRYRYTVVSAVYGVEKYLDDMLASLLRQTLDFKKHIQVILVDDGSVDRSGEICKEWAARFPDNITVIHKENGGQASARNAGIPHAKGDWVTFIDPDDLVDKNYFLNVDHALLADNKKGDVSVVACPYIPYEEASSKLVDRHPLKYRFAHGQRKVVFDDSCDEMQLHVSSTFICTSVLDKLEARFSNIKPSGEDLHFLAKIFLSLEAPTLLYVPNAFYWYRKRADASSTLDTAWTAPERYDQQLEKCYGDLFASALATKGLIPLWLQRTVLYDLSWHVKKFLNNHRNAADIPVEKKQVYPNLLSRLLSHINPDLIKTFELAGVNDDHRFSMLHLGHPELAECSRVKIFSWDKNNQLLGVRYHYVGSAPKVELIIGAEQVLPLYSKTRTHTFLDQITAYSVDAWYPWTDNSMLDIFVNNERQEMSIGQRSRISTINRLTPMVKNTAGLPVAVKVFRTASQLPVYRNKFKDAWLLMDRDTQADDNAEHLYRWITQNKPHINAWFVLRKSSHDWDRLQNEGFNLLDFGSFEHKMALINAAELISSHADHYVVALLKSRYYRDLMQWDFTFLQHGVTKDDLSGWLNSKDIKNFITTSAAEKESLAGDFNNYKFSDKEIKLTGFPRHDALLAGSKASRGTKILVMPTWRQGLVGETLGYGNERKRNEALLDSNFYKNWLSFLQSKKLNLLAKTHGYEIVFFPHANLAPYLDDFRVEGIEILGHADIEGIQKLFLDSALMITDYSSVAFEMAYINRPVFYYQFDEDFVFGGGHTTQKGYFDYRRDGFGPVCTELDELLLELERCLQQHCQPAEPFKTRMDDFFAFRDGKCCERVFGVIAGADNQ